MSIAHRAVLLTYRYYSAKVIQAQGVGTVGNLRIPYFVNGEEIVLEGSLDEIIEKIDYLRSQEMIVINEEPVTE